MKTLAAATFALLSVAPPLLAQAPPPPPPLVVAPTPAPAAVQPAVVPGRSAELEVKIEKKVQELKRTLANEDDPVLTEPQNYAVTLTLRNPAELKGAVVEYRVYYTGSDVPESTAETRPLEKKEGVVPISSLSAGQSLAFETPFFDVPRSTSRKGYNFYPDGRKTRFRSELVGVWLRVRQGEKLLFEWVEPNSLKREGF